MKYILVFLSALAICLMVPNLGEAQTAFNLFELIHGGHVNGSLNSNVEIWRYYGDGTRIPYRIETPCGTVDPRGCISNRSAGRLYWGNGGSDTHTFTITYDPVWRDLALYVQSGTGGIVKSLFTESPLLEAQTFCYSQPYTPVIGDLVGDVNTLLMVIRATAGKAVDSCGSGYLGCKAQLVRHSRTELSNLVIDNVPIEGFYVEADLNDSPESDEFTNESRINLAVPNDQPWTLTGNLTVTFEAEDMVFSPEGWRVGLTAYGQYAVTADSDRDTLADGEDVCPVSDMSEIVIIGDCNSGVQNFWFGIGCTISDAIALCAAEAENHGQFVSCVSLLTDFMIEEAIITGREKGSIQRCAAKAAIP